MAKTAAPTVLRMAVKKRPSDPAPAPAAEVTKSAKKTNKPKAEPAPKTERSARYVGVTSGLSVVEYQNKTLAANFRAKQSDAALAKQWRDEFPRAIPYTEDHVAGVRNAWNKGKHGNDAPAKQLHPYTADGTELPLWGEKTKAAEKAAKPVAKPAAKPVAKVVKKIKTVSPPEDDEE